MERKYSTSTNDIEHSTMNIPPKIAKHYRSPKRFSISSRFYENFNDPQIDDVLSKNNMEARKHSTKQSQRLPQWVWFSIAKSLGIPLHSKDTPVLATILHLLTFSSAITFVVSQVWYIVYDIASEKTKQDTLSGTVSILIALMWSSLGLYAKSLSGRLFRHPRFLGDIRMHSRTIFKINAAFLVFLLGLFFIVVQDLQSAELMHEETCQKIEMEMIVCQIQFVSRVIFSVFSLIWNTLVAIVIISLCRTHTIGIRRFIRELEFDAFMNDRNYCNQFQEAPMTKEDICEETFWLEEDLSMFDEDESRFVVLHHKKKDTSAEQNSSFSSISTAEVCETGKNPVLGGENEENENGLLNEVVSLDIPLEMENIDKKSDLDQPDGEYGSKMIPIKLSSSSDSIKDDLSILNNNTMTTSEILHKYWKISCRLRVTSCALQRWMASLIALVIVWCFVYLIHWQDHQPTVQDVLQFVLPLLLLPLLCSAFAEVNMEGNRMIQCLCPTEERLSLLRFLGQSPLHMRIFGVSLSYGTIMTVVFAIFAAFTSRLIFSEMSKTS